MFVYASFLMFFFFVLFSLFMIQMFCIDDSVTPY